MKLKTTCLVYSAAILICTVCSCGGKKPSAVSTADGFSTITINDIEQKDINLSEICDSIEYVKLETNEKCLIGYITKIIPIGDSLLVVDKETARKIFLFDGNGKFIRQIAQRGDAPQDYISISDITVDVKNGRVFILDAGTYRILVYNLDGSYEKTIKLSFMPYKLNYMDENILVFYLLSKKMFDKESNMSPCICLYDVEKEEVKHLFRNEDNSLDVGVKITPLNVVHSDYNGNVVYLDDMCDTIYRITKNSIEPDVFLDYGEEHRKAVEEFVSTAKQGNLDAISSLDLHRKLPLYFKNRAITGGNFFAVLFNSKDKAQILLYNKKTGNVKLSHLKKNGGFGIKNDIDKLSNFNMYAADKEYVYGTLSIEMLLLPIKADFIEAIDSLKTITTETDNPIIVKFKMKDF